MLVAFALASIAFAVPVVRDASTETAASAKQANTAPVTTSIPATAIRTNVIKPAGTSTYALSECRPTFTAKAFEGIDRAQPEISPPIA